MRLLFAALLLAAPVAAEVARQTEADAYTRYELLSPDSHKFRIVYEVTATTPGATRYFNPIRPGSTASDEHVGDRATGQPLAFAEVGGDAARAGGLPDADPSARFIAVTLAHPVPDGGEARLLIDKTYADAASYRRDGDTLVFERSLGIKRNAVVLPPGYELIACNMPSQVLQQPDGRVMVSFWNASPAPAPLVLKARPARLPAATPGLDLKLAAKLGERAHQDREIVYYLGDPATHSFDLTHDYTESRPGTAAYVNIVRAGSRVANPRATDLDTGAALPGRTIRGTAVAAAEPEAKDVTADTEAVVFRFAAVRPGTSRRIRISETYTDPDRYTVTNGELIWHRSFGRPANAIVLPAGWALTNSSIPATVTLTPEGRIRLDFVNARPDEIDVVVTARRGG